jgi:hypothetical protein
MPQQRLILGVAVVLAALAAAPAFASGGGGGGGGSGSGSGGSGGGGSSCVPLTAIVGVAHSDSGASEIGSRSTVRNCGTANEWFRLTVTVPGSGTVPFAFDGAVSPGRSLTENAGPIGSTPLALHYGQTYDVITTLSVNGTTVATIHTAVTMPAGPVG